MCAKTVSPLALTSASSLVIVSFGPWLLRTEINPYAAMACSPRRCGAAGATRKRHQPMRDDINGGLCDQPGQCRSLFDLVILPQCLPPYAAVPPIRARQDSRC